MAGWFRSPISIN